MKKLFLGAALVFLCSVTALIALTMARSAQPKGPGPLAPDPDIAGTRMPEFTLTTQDKRPFGRSDLRGQITVIDFMFTHCPFICPILTSKMRDMSVQLKDTPVRFVSFSVDPAHDTPERLAEYAAERKLDTSRWTFLTGDFQVVKRIAQEELKFALEEDTRTPVALPDGSTMNNILHPGHFVLLGPDAEVLGVYPAKDDAQLAKLVQRAKDACAELAKRK